jgi:peptidoglycan/LPS O-acetylase OafA/YrhL
MVRLSRLDGLRALAVFAVVQQHWGNQSFNTPIGPGGPGVYCFFVLSGFLITGILLRIREQGGGAASLVIFYLRRSLRIFPAYYLVLLVGALLSADVRDVWPWHAVYLSNVKGAIDGRYLGAASHFWSLAVEEQFYLVWPALILFTPRAWLERVILAIVIIAPMSRAAILALTAGNQFAAMNLLPSVVDCLGLGAWLACRHRHSEARVSAAVLCAGLLLALGEAGAVLLDVGLPWRVAFGTSAYALIFVWLIDHIAHEGAATQWLAWRPLVYVGTVSYGVYLVHNFVYLLIAVISPGLSSWIRLQGSAQALVVLVVSVGLASASWFAFERPLNGLKRFLPYDRNTTTATTLGFAGAP